VRTQNGIAPDEVGHFGGVVPVKGGRSAANRSWLGASIVSARVGAEPRARLLSLQIGSNGGAIVAPLGRGPNQEWRQRAPGALGDLGSS